MRAVNAFRITPEGGRKYMMKRRCIWTGAIIAFFICVSFLFVSVGKDSLSAFCNMQGVKSITFYESADTVSGVFDYQSNSRFYKVQEGALFEKYRSWFSPAEFL